jgi:hypothetical protein
MLVPLVYDCVSTAISFAITDRNQYVPRGRNQLHTIFERHFEDFCEQYDEKYAATYGRYRLERIQQLGERFSTCGDYLQGVARIRCTNPECGHDYFRPFSCKGFYLCPSCSRKRTILFAEHLTNEVLLKLPHRQFVFTMPKALRPFFRHDRRLFAEVSRLIYDILRDFYREAAGRQLLTGMVIAHQTFGDQLRFNPHFHAIVLEGGFDEEGTFFFIPFSGLQSMVEVFRRWMIKLLVGHGWIDPLKVDKKLSTIYKGKRYGTRKTKVHERVQRGRSPNIELGSKDRNGTGARFRTGRRSGLQVAEATSTRGNRRAPGVSRERERSR